MQEIYQNGTYLENNPTWHEENSEWKAVKIIQLLNRNRLTSLTICEVGCGSGEILNQLSNRLDKRIQFFGYEISEQAFQICQKKTKPGLAFYHQDLLLAKNVFFDVVMVIDVLEHVEDYLGFLSRLKDKGKHKLFSIPLDVSVLTVSRSEPLMKVRKKYGHIHYFTKETALASLKDKGYRILDYFYYTGLMEFPNLEFKAALLKYPRKLLFSINQDLAARILGGFALMVLAE
jgi:SAM-dependent methyltransferase